MTSIEPPPESRSKNKPVPPGAGPDWKPEGEEEEYEGIKKKPKVEEKPSSPGAAL